MEADPDAFVAGEDVGRAGGVFGSFRGLNDRFGDMRVVDTPISEHAIVGVGRIRNDTAWNDGTAEPRPTLTLSLTWDHRTLDGAPAARFAGAVRNWPEAR